MCGLIWASCGGRADRVFGQGDMSSVWLARKSVGWVVANHWVTRDDTDADADDVADVTPWPGAGTALTRTPGLSLETFYEQNSASCGNLLAV